MTDYMIEQAKRHAEERMEHVVKLDTFLLGKAAMDMTDWMRVEIELAYRKGFMEGYTGATKRETQIVQPEQVHQLDM